MFSEIYSTSGNPIKKVYFKNTFIKAEVVSDQKKIEMGLGGRKDLPEGRGMLFLMPKADYLRFWMKGMQFSIDIIWIEQGRVVGCEKNISPKDERIFTSPTMAGLVLETPAGFCDKYNISVNDAIVIR
jgi:uncharacterized membrane protein (UPF0127 family)